MKSSAGSDFAVDAVRMASHHTPTVSRTQGGLRSVRGLIAPAACGSTLLAGACAAIWLADAIGKIAASVREETARDLFLKRLGLRDERIQPPEQSSQFLGREKALLA